jgi:hypothetical protein
MAMHARWKRAGLSNNTLLVVHCDGAIAPERIQLAAGRLLDVCPWPASRLRRSFPWGKLHWAARPRATLTPLPVRLRVAATGAELQRALELELNETVDPRREPPIRFLLIDPGPEPERAESVLVITWFHPLMDPRGGQSLLGLLADLDRGEGNAPWAEGDSRFAVAPDPRPLRERGRIARRSLEYMRRLSPVPPISPAIGLATPGRVRFRQARFLEREPNLGGHRAMREIGWRLAVTGHAMADLWRRRGLPDTPFLVPISVDLRTKGEPGPIFGNMLAFHFARFRPSETGDIPRLARFLRQQLADALRDGQIDANAVAMEFLRYRPVSAMLRTLPWTSGGEAFSFHCADLGEFPPAVDRVFGRRIVNAYHAPAVPPRPGVGVFFNRTAGKNNLVVAWAEGVLSDADVARIMKIVSEGMGWVETA